MKYRANCRLEKEVSRRICASRTTLVLQASLSAKVEKTSLLKTNSSCFDCDGEAAAAAAAAVDFGALSSPR